MIILIEEIIFKYYIVIGIFERFLLYKFIRGMVWIKIIKIKFNILK